MTGKNPGGKTALPKTLTEAVKYFSDPDSACEGVGCMRRLPLLLELSDRRMAFIAFPAMREKIGFKPAKQ